MYDPPGRSRHIYHREFAQWRKEQLQPSNHRITSSNTIMHFSSIVLLASSGAASASIFSNPTTFDFSSLIKRKASCPTYWQQISKDLNARFLDTNGQCNANARAAVRYAFHDAGPYSQKFAFVAPAGGGADGSLLLNAGEMGRGENGGLESYNTFIGDRLQNYRSQFGSSVGAADLIQFASRYVFTTHITSVTLANKSLTALQSLHVRVGRKSRQLLAVPTAAPQPQKMPCRQDSVRVPTTTAFSNSSSTRASPLLSLPPLLEPTQLPRVCFPRSKNIFCSLTTRPAFNQAANKVPSNAPQDSTPGKWDINYYAETYNPPAGVSRFDSDIK
jgi:hypothetical protein